MRNLLLSLTLTGVLLAAPSPVTIDFGGQRPAKTVQVSTDYTWTQDDALTLYDPASSSTVTFQIDPGTDVSAWSMKVMDRVSFVGGAGGGTVFPNFVLNGRSVSTEAIPWNQFTSTSYPVGPLLKPGKNVLQITATVTESVNEYQIERIVFGP